MNVKMLRARRVAGKHRNVGDVIQNVPEREGVELVARKHAVQMPNEETRGAEAAQADAKPDGQAAAKPGKGKGGQRG